MIYVADIIDLEMLMVTIELVMTEESDGDGRRVWQLIIEEEEKEKVVSLSLTGRVKVIQYIIQK